jgi:penicillin-insensitive murein endopeptidase
MSGTTPRIVPYGRARSAFAAACVCACLAALLATSRSTNAAPDTAKVAHPKPAAAKADSKAGKDSAGKKTAAKKPAPIPAKKIFGAVKVPASLASRSIGSYARGCLAGAKPLPVDGPAWQAMRLSRNRNWGHPQLISLIERFAIDSKKDGWPGLLVGDISQPRGGPMLTGHASHQIGLDADIWFTPMPENRRLTSKERETLSATSMLDATKLAVDPKVWTQSRVRLIKRVASYPEIERVLVHPAIKKALCEAAGTDRKWLEKVRPYWGHYYHFHIRIACPKNSRECKPQFPVPGNDGCGKELSDWFALLKPKPKPPKPPGEKKVTKPAKPKPPITLADLPDSCKVVLNAAPEPAVAEALSKPATTETPVVAPAPRPAVNPKRATSAGNKGPTTR